MNLQREREFIQACLAHLVHPDQPLPEPPNGQNWPQVLCLLDEHKLTGIFFQLGQQRADLWSQAVQKRLRRDYAAVRLWGDLCLPEVQSVLAALKKAGVRCLVLKGWALIPTVYGGDHGRRVCGDLDVLVHPQDTACADQILLGQGYASGPEPWPGFQRRYRYARLYTRPRRPWPFAQAFSIAVHWGLLDTPFYLDKIAAPGLFQRSQALLLGAVEGLALGIEDSLVYACGHLALHHDYDDALYRYYEMAWLIVHAGAALDWQALAARADEWRLVLPVQRVVGRLQTLWPGVVPEGAAGQIAALRATRSERWIHRCVVGGRQNYAVRAFLAWLTMPGSVRRWRYLCEVACPGPDYLRQHYGAAPWGLWPVHYLRRFWLAVRYAAAAAGRGRVTPPSG